MTQHAVSPTPSPAPSAWPSASPPRDPRITPRHLALRVINYVRQPSPTQVQRHAEGARRQYHLAERAAQLGWEAEQVTVIDGDLGKSGAGSAAAHGRDGFAQLVSAVGLGEVGLVLALEVSRLARNSAEWYRLLDLAALTGTLLGDEDGLYDPRAFNDRLLLGLRGTISEVELHCIQARLHGAELSKARRGELRLRLPVGFVHGPDGQVDLDPDQEVQGAIRSVFAAFDRLGSACAVLRFLREHDLTIPRLRWAAGEPHEVCWTKPSYQAIYHILANPVYAGAYHYGQRGRDVGAPTSPSSRGQRRRRHALEEIAVLLPDHHPGYLTWDHYLANRQVLRDNAHRYPNSRGAPRSGPALLAGIAYCGRCGGRMRPFYGRTTSFYGCASRNQQYDEPVCQSLAIEPVDRAVRDAFLAVIRPAEVEALLALSEELERERARVVRQWDLRLERARYEAERARRQFDRVEPENRLVARELEGRWNDALRAVADLEAEYRRERERGLAPLTDEERTLLRRLVGDVPTLWEAATTAPDERKRFVRCHVREVVLLRDHAPRGAAGTNTVRIGWRGGAWTELAVRRPGAGDHCRTPEAVLARIRVLAQAHPDDRVAEILNADGLRTRHGLPWDYSRVKGIRRFRGIPTRCPVMPRDWSCVGFVET
jgi:DNA invertase Pin-like site-specific DNA recombinase